jgi:hypothetical protein
MSAACASGRGQYCLCQFCRSAGEPGQRAFQLGEAPAVTQTTDEHRAKPSASANCANSSFASASSPAWKTIRRPSA